MFEREMTFAVFVMSYCRALTADLEDARLAEQPFPGMNHPAWTLGHLAIGTGYAVRLLGQTPSCPSEWFSAFGPGSSVKPERAMYPSKDDLIGAIEAGHRELLAALPTADLARMKEPHKVTFDLIRTHLPTVGDLITHLVISHPMAHLGQLTMWRRLIGLPHIF